MLILSLLFVHSNAIAQCDIVSKREACIDDLVGFSLNAGANSVASYSWNFGAFGNSSNSTPLVKFTASGTFQITCTATLSGGGSCIDTHSITIYKLPTANAGFDGNSKYCEHENEVCLNNTSTLSGRGLKQVTVVWGDGNITRETPPDLDKFCHTFADTGKYQIAMEIEDSAGCKNTFKTSVKILQSVDANLKATSTFICDSLRVCVDAKPIGGKSFTINWHTNPSRVPISKTAPFCLTYKPNTEADIWVVAKNEFGCVDSQQYQRTIPPSPFYLVKIADTLCFNQLQFGAMNFYSGEPVWWELNGKYVRIETKFVIDEEARLGMNYVKIKRLGTCPAEIIDSFVVVGIRARAHLYNENRRKAQDTLFLLDLTQGKGPYTRLWDFGDAYAPKCTTWTAKGLNVGLNCNYSRDSIGRHYYGENSCIAARLLVTDQASGCKDDTLMPVFRRNFCPNFNMPKFICLGDTNAFTMPGNVFKKVGNNNYLFTDTGENADSIVLKGGTARYRYTSIGLKSPVFWRYYPPDTVWTERDGKIVVWFIRNPDGWVADTFKNAVEVIYKPNVDFEIVKAKECNPFQAEIVWKHKEWKNPYKMEIDWGDTTIVDSSFMNDTIVQLKNILHTYLNGGIYNIKVKLTSKKGCSDEKNLTVGFSHSVVFTRTKVCPGVKMCFIDTVKEVSTGKVWKKGNGMGNLKWDWGDGTSDTGFSACHVFNDPGVYKVVLTATSVNGCVVKYEEDIELTGPVAGIKSVPDVFCSEIRQFFDSSFMAGPSNGSSISKWNWNFKDGTNRSFIKNPAHIFPSGGVYSVTLTVTSTEGCVDSSVVNVRVIGPEVRAVILNDSFGCSPLLVKFGNQSKQTKNFIWEFGDSANTVYSTNKDTTVQFRYSKPGQYYAYITGGDSFYNPSTKSYYYCSVRYPAKDQKQLRITVYPTVFSTFEVPPVICLSDSLIIHNTSKDKSLMYHWQYGDGRTQLRKPDTFAIKYNDTGLYRIRLFPQYSTKPGEKTCIDTAVKLVHVIVFKPQFTVNCEQSNGSRLVLNNVSRPELDSYSWSLMNPEDSTLQVLSVSRHLRYDFGNDIGEKIICLGLSDSGLCGGISCQKVIIKSEAFLANVFTPGVDGFNDVFKVPLDGYEGFDLKIFNRWGELVFRSENPSYSWNGKVMNEGTDLPSGTYFYLLNFKDGCNNEPKEIHGSVNLIR